METGSEAPHDEKARLQKKIEEYTQFQGLALLPAWLPGISSLVHHTRTVPGREIYVLLFHGGMFVFGIFCFVMVRLQIKKMKAQLARLEPSTSTIAKPPIPSPFPEPEPKLQPEPTKPADSISVTYRSTRGANWRCNLYTMLHSPAHLLILVLMSVVLSFILPLPVTGFLEPPYSFLAKLVVNLVGFSVVNCVILWVQIKGRLPKADSVRICTSSLAAQGFHDITPNQAGLLSWDKITRVNEHKGDIYVWAGANSGCFVPREAFQNLEDAKRFHVIALRLWKSKGAAWSEVAPS